MALILDTALWFSFPFSFSGADVALILDTALWFSFPFSFSGAEVALIFDTGLTVMETLAVLLVELSSLVVNVKLSDPVYPLFGL